jgi:thiol-disulfide isomerase/thioredoxin
MFGILLLGLAACGTVATPGPESESLMPAHALAPSRASFPDLGLAPELTNEVWLNVDAPLRLADLRGKVVALEMWTFGCINCRNVLPSLRGWHEEYADQGLVIIGNHYPEFSYEEDLDNLKQAVNDLDIQYAVAQDNDRKTWAAYENRYWPTLYLIDKRGHIRYVHIGEGRYAETEAAIQALLAETYP